MLKRRPDTVWCGARRTNAKSIKSSNHSMLVDRILLDDGVVPFGSVASVGQGFDGGDLDERAAIDGNNLSLVEHVERVLRIQVGEDFAHSCSTLALALLGERLDF